MLKVGLPSVSRLAYGERQRSDPTGRLWASRHGMRQPEDLLSSVCITRGWKSTPSPDSGSPQTSPSPSILLENLENS